MFDWLTQLFPGTPPFLVFFCLAFLAFLVLSVILRLVFGRGRSGGNPYARSRVHQSTTSRDQARKSFDQQNRW